MKYAKIWAAQKSQAFAAPRPARKIYKWPTAA